MRAYADPSFLVKLTSDHIQASLARAEGLNVTVSGEG